MEARGEENELQWLKGQHLESERIINYMILRQVHALIKLTEEKWLDIALMSI